MPRPQSSKASLATPPQSDFWLVKQEPETYAWQTFCAEKGTAWTGVRSFPGRLNLRGMKTGDQVLFYHSGGSKEIVGIAEVTRAAYPDPTVEPGEGEWVAVDLKPVRSLVRPVSLTQIKAQPQLANIALVRQSRLSVMPLARSEFDRILELSR